ncbi:hypothetical protein RQP46_009688 [Phenoliferia psychrophenolica]
MKSFPPEIWRLVLKEAVALESPTISKPTLVACALVCTMWTPIAQELLWEEVNLVGWNGHAQKFLASAGTGRASTKSLRLGFGIDLQTTAGVLEKVKGLVKLEADERLEGIGSAILSTPLEHLQICFRNWTKRDIDSLLAATAASPALSELKSVTIGVSRVFWDWKKIDADGKLEGTFKQYGLDVLTTTDDHAYLGPEPIDPGFGMGGDYWDVDYDPYWSD